MVAKKPSGTKRVDDILKAILVLSRTTEYVLETQAVNAAVNGRKGSSSSQSHLSGSKVKILRLLGQRKGQTSTQVARFLGVSKPAVTQIIDSMMRAKLVTRRTGTRDRREVNIQLTPKGRDLNQSVRRTQRLYIRNALRNRSKHDADRWVATLRDVSGVLALADRAFQRFCAQSNAHEDGTCVLEGGDATCLYRQTNSR